MKLTRQSCVQLFKDKRLVETTVLVSPNVNNPVLVRWEDLMLLRVIPASFPAVAATAEVKNTQLIHGSFLRSIRHTTYESSANEYFHIIWIFQAHFLFHYVLRKPLRPKLTNIWLREFSLDAMSPPMCVLQVFHSQESQDTHQIGH